MNKHINSRNLRKGQLCRSPGSPQSRLDPLPWKENFRKKCFERLKERRASLIEQFRYSNSPPKSLLKESDSPSKVVSDVMEQEWTAINQSRSFPSLRNQSLWWNADFGDADEQLMKATLREIQNELENEDEIMLNEILQFDSKDLESKVESFFREEVICPICKIRQLREERNSTMNMWTSFQTPQKASASNPSVMTVKCDCGLTLSGVDLSLNKVQLALQNMLGNHEKHCFTPLTFTVTEDSAATNVLVTCSVCDWMTFLL